MTLLVIIVSVLSGILGGEYNAKTLPIEKQDSILSIGIEPAEGVSTRYQLISENEERIFRHSRLADWYVVDSEKGYKRKVLGASLQLGKVRDAQLSPNGRYVAFAKDNNLYIHKLDFGTEVAITKDADPDIINGIADWLYEEEFGTTKLFAWSPDSKQLAFVKLDEREVPDFSYEKFLTNERVNELTSERYPQYTSQEHLRYPKAGCSNAKASVCVYDVGTKGIVTMPVESRESRVESQDFYIPRLRWIDANTLAVLKLNRDQTKMEVLACNSRTTVSHPLYKEESKQYYVDYSLFDEWQWLSDGRFIVLSEKDGWRRAYLYSAQGVQQRALTPEGIDVTALYAVNEKSQTLYYQAAEKPSSRQIYCVGVESRESRAKSPIQLTKEEGLWSARFAKDGTKAVLCYQSFEKPNTYTLWEFKGSKVQKVQELLNNEAVEEAWKANGLPEPELLRIKVEGVNELTNERELEAMLLKPSVISNQPSALVVMHYSGPASQRVLNRWRKKFEYALVEAGYAVLIVDTRGSDCRGREWRNATYMNLGQKEAEDLIAAANWAGQRPDIDAERMAILGWSYGGYQTLMTMSQPNHPFKAGIAIAPVTDWRLYDSAYTERYMRRPQVNDRGYEAASLLNRAADLTGEVLIIHGTGDDNVHVQHTMQYIDALVQAEKQFEMQLYTDDNHHLKKGKNSQHMHKKVLLFLKRAL